MPGCVPVTAGRHGRGPGDAVFVVLAAQPGPERTRIGTALEAQRIEVATVEGMRDLRVAVQRLRPDVAVVDIRLSHDGLAAVLALIRRTGTALIPLAVADSAARTRLLLAGADDCLPDAFSADELAARVVAVSRRSSGAALPGLTAVLQVGSLRFDPIARRVEVGGTEVFLTSREFELLDYFLHHPGEALSRGRLLAEVWGYTFGSLDTVTVHVRRLRTKIEIDPSRPQFIHTVWGVGYRFGDG